MSLHIVKPGALTTVQDAGRFGHAADGYRTCGAADGTAYRVANALLGNSDTAAVLECTLQGFTLTFTEPTVFALTGGDFAATLDGKPVPRFAPLFAPAGARLVLGLAREGLRGYLAVAGGLATPPVLGSRATDTACHIGGLEGRALQAGDELPVGYTAGAAVALWQKLEAKGLARPLQDPAICRPATPARYYGGKKVTLLRCVPGPQNERFTLDAQRVFTRSIYTITPDSNRMACKLAGTPLVTADAKGVDILSDGIVAGSVQVSANGQPIVMQADHQTTGGYAKIATVITSDLPALAQLRPGEPVCFTYITAAEAVAAARREAAKLAQIKERL